MSDVLETINTLKTPHSRKAKSSQVMNNAGGYVFAISPEDRIRRFLILGTTGGTYYQGERELTLDNATEVLAWAENSPVELVNILLEISEGGRAPKQNPTIFALAAVSGLADTAGRQYAFEALPRICRTASQLFLYAKYVGQFRGWGKCLRNAVGSWYESKPADKLAYQMIKYRNRENWTHRDLLRKSHPVGVDTQHKALYDWATKGNVAEYSPAVLHDFVDAGKATTVKQWVEIVQRGRLSWEMLPDAALTSPDVWEALIESGVPMTALIRQLPRLTNLGVLKGATLKTVLAQLTNQEAISKARIHPINVLIAQRTYAGGRSARGNGSWTPNVRIVDALDKAFYLAFGNVKPSGKRILNALDVSGSMSAEISGLPLSCREASAAMSLVTLATEDEVETIGFTASFGVSSWRRNDTRKGDRGVSPLPISARQRLDDVVRTISGLSFGGTDCSAPMLWAMDEGKEFDHIQIFTDSETWAGSVHPMQALRLYRQETGIPTSFAVVGMTSTGFSIADPEDKLSLDVVGLDSAVPQLLSDFAAGRV